MDCGLLCIVNRANFVLSALCVPFYILFLLSIAKALIKQPDRIHRVISFYWLLISAGVADLWYLGHYYFFNRFRKWGWFVWPAELVPHYAVIGTWGLRQSQVLATLLMAVNRMFAICWPGRYQSWQNSLTRKIVALQWLLSLVLAAPGAIQCQIGRPNNVTSELIKNPQSCAKVVFGAQTLVQLTVAIALLVIYSIIYTRMRHQSTKIFF